MGPDDEEGAELSPDSVVGSFELEVPPDLVASAVIETEALKTLRETSHRDWQAAAWLLERRFPENWGSWHAECMPDVHPPEPVQPTDPDALAAIAILESSEDWRPRCRVCGEPLAATE